MKILNWIKREKFILLSSIILGIIITGIFINYSKQYSDAIQTSLSKSVIRFHVIANSDSDEDQDIKKEVRDAILQEMTPLLSTSNKIDITRNIIIQNMDKIKEIAENVIKERGKDYSVEVSLGPAVFPTKQYGDIVFPTGEYEALKVSIGEAKGKNWWCVMFPPLCFVDVTHGIVPQENKEDLKKVLNEEEYKLVTGVSYEDNIPVKVKFKIVEWWQERKINKKHQLVKE
ncbi:stage II sporulation protein R [Defluviitalea phaphyphila]|uniref:stage II sporulation protein R n=1 Tax=Defluviitalea phaphyphila TaxID=1473580 RepID=UPI0007309621|nr:stage II sporulation protein R [Defluviitalea phaphyphila]